MLRSRRLVSNYATTVSLQLWTQQHPRVHSLEMATALQNGAEGNAKDEAFDLWLHEWLTLLHTEYVLRHSKTLKQVKDIIVSVDEVEFHYKALPQHTFYSREDRFRANYSNLPLITGLFGATASGHKFKPLIIGRFANPGSFQQLTDQNKSVSDLPIHYTHNRNAWMTADIFREWFVKGFQSEVEGMLDPDMKIQFIIESCMSHRSSVTHRGHELQYLSPHITFQYLPPKCNPQIAPMDRSVKLVQSFQRRRFYHKLFGHCEKNPNQEEALNEFLRLYNILEAIYDIIEGWKEVPHSTIQEDFEQVLPMKKWNELTAPEV